MRRGRRRGKGKRGRKQRFLCLGKVGGQNKYGLEKNEIMISVKCIAKVNTGQKLSKDIMFLLVLRALSIIKFPGN